LSPVAVETRKQQRERIRSERKAAEARAQAARDQRKRLIDLGGAAVLALATVAALIAISQAGIEDQRAPTPTAMLKSDLAQRFADIPQRGDTLGEPDAPVTLVEFADLQCPFCAQYDRDVLPTIIDRYVRAGSIKLVFRPLRFLGPDSEQAAAAVGAAAGENRMWQFVDAFYHRQGEENSGYVTDDFMRDLARAIPGLDANALLAGDDALARLAESEANTYGIESTPSFLVGRSGGELSPLGVSELTPAAFTSQLDPIVKAQR
jgi:protein-disulfide isomerase